MLNRHAKEKDLQNPEVVLNLWAYVNEGGYIQRIAGKFYVLDGTDQQKLAALRQLSGSDFLSAPWHPVPKSFRITNPDGEELLGVAHVSMLPDPNTHPNLFGQLMDELATHVPTLLRSIDGEYKTFKLELPEAPLCVTTQILEFEDGRLVPMVSA
jgi:hypothetical protein